MPIQFPLSQNLNFLFLFCPLLNSSYHLALKMAQNNFTLLINLSHFFKDHRQIARIFIDDKLTTIRDIKKKIIKVFGIENFGLVSNNEYLPPSEDIRILRRDDIIWAIPAESGNIEVGNIECSPTKLKKTKRKSNLVENGADEDVSKKRKQSKSEAKTKIATEEIEDDVNRKKKKKKRHIYEEECVPKDSKKNKYKDVEQSETTKKIENSTKKNISNYNNYKIEKSMNDYQVTVGNSLPENVSFKKYTQIPTITDEYLKEKKINIVKIDHISKPPASNQSETPADQIEISSNYIDAELTLSKPSPADRIKSPSTDKIEISSNYIDAELTLSPADQIKSPSVDKIEIGPTQNDTEVTKNSSDFIEPQSSSIKTDNGVKSTKFFFLNTPSRQKIEKPVKQKRSNVFKLNLSPIMSGIKKIETKQEAKLAEEKRNDMHQLGLCPSLTSNEKMREEELAEDLRMNMFKADSSPVVTENEEICIESSSIDNSNTNENVTQTEEINLAETLQLTENTATPNGITNGHSYSVTPDIYIQDTHIIPGSTPDENADSGITDSSMKAQRICSMFNKRSNFQRISQISSCITTILDTPGNEFGISGLELINCSKYSARKQISGVGQLLGSIRNSESFSGVGDVSSNNDITTNVTKRKRIRKTRSKKKKNTSINADEIPTPIGSSIPTTPRPMLTDANPKLHIKFSDDAENNVEDDSVISIGSENGDLQLVEENILKAPMMCAKGPKTGNIISFKILKISDDFTPEVSSYIIGRVINFSDESKLVVLEITFGLDQFDEPTGKFSVNDEENRSISCLFKECLWTDLIEPRLIYP